MLYPLVEQLLSQGLLKPSDCHSAEFSIEERRGRNALLIIRTPTSTFTHKRIDEQDGHTRERAALAHLTKHHPKFEIPRVLSSGGGTLLCTSSRGRISLHERWSDGVATKRLAQRLGQALASLHSIPSPDLPSRMPLGFLPTRASIDVLSSSAGCRDVIRRLQDDGIDGSLSDLSNRLSDESVFCHGDVRAANVLVDQTGSEVIELIDWETAGPGSHHVDLGAGLAIFVELALLAGRGSPQASVVRGFLDGYSSAAGLRDIVLTVQCAGARLLQMALEYGAASYEAPEITERHIKIGCLFLRNPYEGAIHLGLLT